MSTSIQSQIKTKIANIGFSDNSKVIERASGIIVKNDSIGFSIDISGIDLEEANQVREIVNVELQTIPNISKINVVLTSSENKNKAETGQNPKIILDDINKVILIVAGKGGVGKTTISSLLAQKLATQGKKVGLLDADIYGPSIPTIFSLNGKPKILNKRMIPLVKHNVKINSIGFITDPLSSISWRGPMVSKALNQLISLTDWGKLDYLIVDTPPGTGDIHLSFLQNYRISKVIMVTTLQKISAIDVQRAINLYQKFGIAISGVIENMSYYTLPNSSEKIKIFSGGSGNQISLDYGIPLLATVPINTGLPEACDSGVLLNQYFDLLDFEI